MSDQFEVDKDDYTLALFNAFQNPMFITDTGKIMIPPEPINLSDSLIAATSGQIVEDCTCEEWFGGEHPREIIEELLPFEAKPFFDFYWHNPLCSWAASIFLLVTGYGYDFAVLELEEEMVRRRPQMWRIIAMLQPGNSTQIYSEFIVDFVESYGYSYNVEFAESAPSEIVNNAPELVPEAVVEELSSKLERQYR